MLNVFGPSSRAMESAVRRILALATFALVTLVPDTNLFASDWTTFQDPAEQAFQIQVPKGWKITGGTYRFGKLDPRIMIDMVSPDGKTNVRIGDYHVPPFAPLVPTMISLGWREGHPYSPNGVAQEIVANYRPGWVFADLYGQGRFSSMCRHLGLKSMKQQTPVHSAAPNTTITAGDVVYSCDSADGPQIAYVFAETQFYRMQSNGTWLVSWLYSFIAPQNRAQDALKIALQSLSTITINPQWEYRQLQLNGAAGDAAMAEFRKAMSDIHADYERRSAASQSQFDSMDRAIRGVDLTVDPVDGKQREVGIGTGGAHWINGLGDVINSPDQPGPDSHRLNNVH